MAASLWIDIWKFFPADGATVWIRRSGHTPVPAVFTASTSEQTAFFTLQSDEVTTILWLNVDEWHAMA